MNQRLRPNGRFPALLGETIDCLSTVVRRDSYRTNTPSLLAGFQHPSPGKGQGVADGTDHKTSVAYARRNSFFPDRPPPPQPRRYICLPPPPPPPPPPLPRRFFLN